MASSTGFLCFLGIVKTSCTVSGYAAEQPGIVVILASQKILVLIQSKGQMDFVTSRTELRGLVKVLQESLLMKGWLGLDQLLVYPLQHRVFTECKGIVQWLLNGEVRIAPVGVDIGNCVANSTCDPSLRGWVIHVVKFRIVESPAKKRDRIVAASTPTRCFDVTVSFERNFPCFSHTR